MRPPFLALLAFLVIAVLAAACGRGPAATAAPASYSEAMDQAAKAWMKNRFSEVFAACEMAFRYADREGDSKAIGAAECVSESAARMGKPELALPHIERLFEAHAERLMVASNRHRLANNRGVLLIRKGHRDQGIAVLREALEVYAGTPYHIGSWHSFPARAMIVKNLARAWYESASDPEARTWVREQGADFLRQMEGQEGSVHLRMGASSAMYSLALIGRRQALSETPAWEAVARAWEPLEAGIDSRSPYLARGCGDVALREILFQACMLELEGPR